tara:strand:- start:626 stop:820 length:195 start_codon:yes stop_codon:yes gene_type:complete
MCDANHITPCNNQLLSTKQIGAPLLRNYFIDMPKMEGCHPAKKLGLSLLLAGLVGGPFTLNRKG